MFSRFLAPIAPYLIGGLALALAGTFWLARHEHGEAQKAKAQAELAARQANLNQTVTDLSDKAHRTELVIRSISERSIDAVQQAQGAETPVPSDVLDAWRSGIDSLRNSSGEPSRDDSAQPTG